MITFFKIGDKWLGDGDQLVGDFKNACGFVAAPKRVLEIQSYLESKFNAQVQVHGRRAW